LTNGHTFFSRHNTTISVAPGLPVVGKKNNSWNHSSRRQVKSVFELVARRFWCTMIIPLWKEACHRNIRLLSKLC